MANSNIVPDDRITADSHLSGFEPQRVRMNNKDSAWCASPSETPTLTITFDSSTLVIAVHTKGHPNGSAWVKHYEVNITGTWKGFPGNIDGTNVKGHYFENNVPARSFQLKATDSEGNKCMRLELFGINDGKRICLMFVSGACKGTQFCNNTLFSTNRKRATKRKLNILSESLYFVLKVNIGK